MARVATPHAAVNQTDVSPTPLADGWREPYEAGYRLTLLSAGTNEAFLPGWTEKRLGSRQLEQKAARHPNLNIGVNTGASRLMVVDADDEDPSLIAWLVEQFGPTPMGVWTPSGGAHLYYQCAGVTKGSLRDHPDPELQRPVDLLGEGAQAAAPPSVRPHGSYRLMNPANGWVPVEELPVLDPRHPLLAPWATGSRRRRPVQRVGNVTLLPAYTDGGQAAPGQRSMACLSYLVRGLAGMESAPREAIEAKAWTLGRLFAETRIVQSEANPFTEAKLAKCVSQAVKYTVEDNNLASKGGTRGRLLEDLATFGSDASAIVLLQFLRETHRSRPVFLLDAEAMATAGTLPGWTAYQIKTARKALVEKGRLRLAHQGTGRGNPSIYTLV